MVTGKKESSFQCTHTGNSIMVVTGQNNCFRHVSLFVVLFILLTLSFRDAAAAPGITVHSIEPLDGMTATRAFGINENGKICAVSFSEQEKEVAMTWELPGIRVMLPKPDNAQKTSAWGINDFGQVSGYFKTGDGKKYIARWPDAVTVEKNLSGTGEESRAYDISNDGTVVGVMALNEDNENSGYFHGIVFNGRQIRDLGTLNTRGNAHQKGYSIAHGINNRGEVVGIAADGRQRFRPFIYDRHRGLRPLQIDSGFTNGQWYASVINDHRLVGGSVNIEEGKSFPYYWDDVSGLPVRISMPVQFPYGEIYGINNLGQMVGVMWSMGKNPTEHAFVFDRLSGVRDLNDILQPSSGWTLTFARDINDHGQIAGTGQLHGLTRGFMLDELNIALSGDINRDGNINLEDVVLSLLVLSGKASSPEGRGISNR
jgi:uncharacterized membrane protein